MTNNSKSGWQRQAGNSGKVARAAVSAGARLVERRLLTVFTVTSSATSGAGSLRQAISDANANGGADEIVFNLSLPSGGGAARISVSAGLPQITSPVSIDATTQPGYAGTPLVEVVGAGTFESQSGFDFSAGSGGSVLRGVAVGGYGRGINIAAPDVRVERSYVGLGASGGTLPNLEGIEVRSTGAVIGGTGGGNVISGNT